ASGTAQGHVEVEIPKGATAHDVADRLFAAGLIDRPLVFRLYAGQRGVAGRFKAGRYVLAAPVTPRQILEALVKGAADELVAVTIPEGKNLVEIAEILDAAGIAGKAEIIMRATDASFVAGLGLPGASLEGYLFPDTYKLRPRTPAARALIPMVRRHRQVFEELRAAHAKGVVDLKNTLGFDDYKIVILASIVEKETGQPQERPRIAQVFINRLRFPSFVPKLLQTDPTIIYGCTVGLPRSAACLKWDGRIRRIHLDDRENPFNTYTHEGLPPGPIANPGRAALEAVMAPDHTPFLYFVSRNDGTHYFSKTVAEHQAAVVKYQRGGAPLATP
ncbi:MAG TPA: endolytic transglycosylase MltG, partial [Polyangia bacterium]|nr:endolytic transglycosylase MltG [Polyangia bacterium]